MLYYRFSTELYEKKIMYGELKIAKEMVMGHLPGSNKEIYVKCQDRQYSV